MLDLKDKQIILLAHIFTTVPVYDLKEYLIKSGAKRVLFIGHPLFYVEGRPGAFYELYEIGKLVKASRHKNIRLPAVIQYIKDVLLTIYWVMRSGGHWDLMIALDNLNTISGLILKLVGQVKKVIYYTIDFVPQRFDNSLLNNIYHSIEKFAVRHADFTWNLTERVAKGREDLLGMHRAIYKKQRILPIGIWFDRYPRKNYKDIIKNSIVYAGGLSEHQGVQLVIEALPIVVKKVPDITFDIIGIGTYERELKKLVSKLKLEKYVNFLGYMEDHKDVEKLLSERTLAVAMYSKELSKWSYYADPSKVKSYLAAGLPVVTTDLTSISEDLEKNKCGIIAQYNKKSLANALITILNNPEKIKQYRINSIKFAKGFDWNALLNKELSVILNQKRQ